MDEDIVQTSQSHFPAIFLEILDNRQNNYNMFSLCLRGKQSTCFLGKHILYMFAGLFIPRKQGSSQAVYKTKPNADDR